MPKLYIANTTKQRREFYYHAYSAMGVRPGQSYTRVVLEPGRQIALPGDYPMPWITALIEREAKTYGWLASSEVSRRNSRTAQIVWNIDRPVPDNIISAIIEKNDALLDEEAMQEQRRVAVAASAMANPDNHMTTNAPAPREFDMRLDEQSLIGKMDDDKDILNTTVEVRRGNTGTGRGRGRARKAA